jgi:hypothetical protein
MEFQGVARRIAQTPRRFLVLLSTVPFIINYTVLREIGNRLFPRFRNGEVNGGKSPCKRILTVKPVTVKIAASKKESCFGEENRGGLVPSRHHGAE